MGWHTVSWCFRQKDIPPVARLVLAALSNRADDDTGECFPGIETIARECGLSPRSVITYIAALIRNGYVIKQAMRRKDGARRTNHYWVMCDRVPTPWHNPGTEETVNDAADDDAAEDEAPDVAVQGANPAHCETTKEPAQCANPAPYQGAPACTLQEKSGLEYTASPRIESSAAVPPSFDATARAKQAARLKAAEETRRANQPPVFVWVGSDPWDYHVRNGHKPSLTTVHEGRRGWWFRSLYPPKSTGPPSKDDRRPFDKSSGEPSEPDHSPEKTNDISELADEMGR